MFWHTLFLYVLAVFLVSNGGATHIRTGKVTMEGEVATNEGMRHYSTDAFLIKPVVCWEDLVEDGITVDRCTESKIRYVGNIDEEDFKVGNVVTFPVDVYVGFGCPLPPHSPEEKEPEVIFRKIVSVKFREDKATVHTTFIDPGKVVPTIMLHMGPLSSSDRQIANNTNTDLSPVSRVNGIGVRDFERSGSFTPFTSATISYSIRTSGDICNFRFDVAERRVTWDLTVDVEAIASLTGSVSLSSSASGEIFKVGIPGAGFSMRIFLLGRVSAGFTAALEWETELNLGAAATIQYGAQFTASRRIKLGIGSLRNSPITSSSSATTGSIVFATSVGASATAEGFAGIRPVLAVELELPVIPDAIVGLGATVGLKVSVGAEEPPFPAVTGGSTIGSACSTCHTVEGSLDVEGRRLSITAEADILGKREFVIVDTSFSTRLGTLCLFARTCPAGSGMPVTVDPTTLPPTTATVAPTPPPRPRCPCRCRFGPGSALDCRSRPFCRTRGCGFLRFQCCN